MGAHLPGWLQVGLAEHSSLGPMRCAQRYVMVCVQLGHMWDMAPQVLLHVSIALSARQTLTRTHQLPALTAMAGGMQPAVARLSVRHVLVGRMLSRDLLALYAQSTPINLALDLAARTTCSPCVMFKVHPMTAIVTL